MIILLSIILVVILVSVDFVIKRWAVAELAAEQSRSFLHIGNFKIMDLTYLENDGAVFGSFGGKRWLLIALTSVLILFCIYLVYKYREKSRFMVISLDLVIAGGIGNLIDRIFNNGLVIDYFDVKLFNFAIFNFADCCVTIGIALAIIYIIFVDGRKEKAEKNAG
jgi:signal peptidase II